MTYAFEPRNLIATQDDGDVTLAWEAPAWYDPGVSLSHAGSEETFGAIGWGGANFGEYTVTVVHRFTASHMVEHNASGFYLTRVEFYPFNPAGTYTVHVWTGGTYTNIIRNPGTMRLTRELESVEVGTWTEFTLDEPILVPYDQEMWIGYTAAIPAGRPLGSLFINDSNAAIGVDSGPVVPGQGNVVRTGTGSWNNLPPEQNYNWMIRGWVSHMPGSAPEVSLGTPVCENPTVAIPSSPVELNICLNDMVLSTSTVERAATTSRQRNTRNFIGFDVYRGNTRLNSDHLTELSFVDKNVATGTHDYFLVAVYYGGTISEPAERRVIVQPRPIIDRNDFTWTEGFENHAVNFPHGWVTRRYGSALSVWSINSVNAEFGNRFAMSRSRNPQGTAMDPDNYLITPRIEIPELTPNCPDVVLSYWVAAGSSAPGRFDENYSVLVSVTGSQPDDFKAERGGVELFTERLTISTWQERSGHSDDRFILNQFAGETIRIAFRHHDSRDRSFLALDQVRIEGPTSGFDAVTRPVR
jgi:hypothetical protein